MRLDHLLSRESDERSSRSRCFGQVKVSFSYCSILRALQKETSGKTKKRHPIAMAWGYSSVGRAPALQAGGQGFDSLNLHHMGQYLSWLDHTTDNREVDGSSPFWPTM